VVALVIFIAIICITMWLYYENAKRNRTLQISRCHLRASVQALIPLCSRHLVGCGTEQRRELQPGKDEQALLFLKELETIRSNDHDYYFVLDQQGRCWANGGHPPLAERHASVRPGMVLLGSPHLEDHDENTENGVQRLVQTGMEGGGFVEYKWNSPQHGHSRRSKVSYVERIPDTSLVLGCGMYN